MATTVSDYNLTKISTKELSENLRATIQFGGNVVVVGRRGGGKTTIAKCSIKESGCKEQYINLSTSERCDIGGYPNFFAAQEQKEHKRKFVEYMLPEFFRSLIEGKEKVVALLDEVDKAEPSILAPLLELTQFHTINGSPLPNLQAVIMTGNLQSEGGARPSLPLLDRAEAYLLEGSHYLWLDWASKEGVIHPSITAFIADHPDALFGAVDCGDLYKDESPRGWQNASNLVAFGEANKWSHKIIENKVSGCVGKKSGIKFSAYFTHYTVLLPIIEKIMKGDKIDGFNDLEPSKQMVATMICCSRLARQIDERIAEGKKDLPKTADTVGKFLSKVDHELSLISIRSQLGMARTHESGLSDAPVWDKLLKEISGRINGK
jgi:dynein-related subfamily AAA family protein